MSVSTPAGAAREPEGSTDPAALRDLELERPWTIQRVRDGVRWRIRIWRDRALLGLAASSGFLSSVFYTLASNAFSREHRAVIAGRLAYDRRLRRNGANRYLLRRRVHMLEKGLVMRPRRAVFALKYIDEAVACYVTMLRDAADSSDAPDDAELLWAHDVLEMYFSVAGPHPVISRAKARFDAAPAPPGRSPGDIVLAPHPRDLGAPPSVTPDALEALAWRRRSVRWFDQRPVPREAIDRAITIAGLSPSACNRQPFHFRVIDDPQLRSEVVKVPAGTAGFGENIPVLIVIVGKLRAFFDEKDRHLIYIDGGLAAMSLMFALEVQGIASCSLNWSDVPDREAKMARLLGLEPDERVVMLIGLGFPDPTGMVPYSQKRSMDQLRRYN